MALSACASRGRARRGTPAVTPFAQLTWLLATAALGANVAQRAPLRHSQLLAWRLAGVQNEEQEAQEASPVRDVVGEHLAGSIRRDGWLAYDRYLEACRSESVGHRVQRPVPETEQRALSPRGPFNGVVVGREIIRLGAGSRVPRGFRERMIDGHQEPPAGLEHAPYLGECRAPVLQIMQHEGSRDVIERAVWERKQATRSVTRRSALSPSRRRASFSIPGLLSMPTTTAPRSRSAANRAPAPQPASRIRRLATSPASASIAGRS
jgi:hypothetical protein